MPPQKSKNANLSRSALRRQRERELRYQIILTAAESLFAQNGYHKTSMEQIANAAEYSVGAVYFYFKNKEDLLIRLMDEIGYLLRKTLGTVFKENGSTMDAYKLAGYAFFEDFCVNYPEKCAILFRESAGQSPLVEEHRKKIFDKCTGDVLSALLTASKTEKIKFKNKIASEVISVSIMGIYERVAYQYLFWEDQSADLKTIGRNAVDFILGGIHNLIK